MSTSRSEVHADSLRALEDWSLELRAALAAGDSRRAARAAATISQAVHEVLLVVDPWREACAALTLRDGVYAEEFRPAAALELDAWVEHELRAGGPLAPPAVTVLPSSSVAGLAAVRHRLGGPVDASLDAPAAAEVSA